ncbi:MAG: copper homeostasis protein CutC [Ignavibacteriales bacterium]|nr:copper homeostasis protein CutC [Ignavibacteriales bacterium]
MILEVCVDSVESAVAAQRGGAGRIELCADLEHGGTTPSIDMIRSVREQVSLKVHVMIRPRTGDFCYSKAEFEVMKRDVQESKKLGIDGLVFGILTSNGTIDTARTKILLEMARLLSVTFHRAFDETVDLFAALSELTQLGVDRVLTSGGKPSVETGVQTLADLVRKAGSSIKVLAGGGITVENVADVIEKTNVDEVHALSSVSSTFVPASSDSKFSRSPRLITDASKVRKMVDILQRLSPRK